MTSSAASETETARNFTSGWVACTCLMTSTPPPPGRCTSSRTTSGVVRVMAVTAVATSSPSPTMVTYGPMSCLTPLRNIA
jgi:hypothetical protein